MYVKDEEKQLKGALSWQYKPKPTDTCLGDEVCSYFKKRNRTLGKNAALVDIWQAVMPPTLQPFCRLDRCVGNTLYLQAEPGPYMHQAQLLSSELLEQINKLAPCSGVQKIRVVPKPKDDKE
jgi:hypothetical protein